ncbi:Endonuclease/exonuclease/phosphatase superfamily [Sesbania bispinosa]|nr:Endonuclease/exonuclease/phosphatase superfamily [Sesbania bispinosa]
MKWATQPNTTTLYIHQNDNTQKSKEPISVTQIDLQGGERRAGLGPKRLKDLHIATELISLPSPIVNLDYPSPVTRRHEGADLSMDDIMRVKVACRTQAELEKRKGAMRKSGWCQQYGRGNWSTKEKEDPYPGMEKRMMEMMRIVRGAMLTMEEAPGCTGDFNEILSQSKKFGLQPQRQSRMDLFREFLHANELIDLETKGCQFIWTSNPRDGFVTKERLDRIQVNWAWRSKFEHALATTLPAISFDHSPLVLWHKPNLKGENPFRFEAMWEEHSECNQIIEEGWQNSIEREDVWTEFLKKAKNCKRSLKNWNQRTFKKAYSQIASLKKELEELQNSNPRMKDWNRIKEVKKEIDRYLKQEELYWAQRSRLKWLKTWGPKYHLLSCHHSAKEGQKQIVQDQGLPKGLGRGPKGH